jgi:hypothetical protein
VAISGENLMGEFEHKTLSDRDAIAELVSVAQRLQALGKELNDKGLDIINYVNAYEMTVRRLEEMYLKYEGTPNV